MQSLTEPIALIVIGIAGAIGFAAAGWFSTALAFLLVAIGGAFEYRATSRFNEEPESLDSGIVNVNPTSTD